VFNECVQAKLLVKLFQNLRVLLRVATVAFEWHACVRGTILKALECRVQADSITHKGACYQKGSGQSGALDAVVPA
jgi:hypothetical protein